MLISKAIATSQRFKHHVVMLHAVACDDILYEQISVCFIQNILHYQQGGRVWRMAKGVMHSKGRACVAKGSVHGKEGGRRVCAWQEGMHGRRGLHGKGGRACRRDGH